jgi:hypothetical protein
MKFGGKPTMADKMAVATKQRRGKPVKTKDIAPIAKPKIKPKLGKDSFGATVKWKF